MTRAGAKMDTSSRPIPEDNKSASVLDWVFRDQLRRFMEGLDVAPVTLEQDMRAGVVAFIATFASEVLGQSTITLFSESMSEIWERPTYWRDDWWKVAFLAAGHSNLFGTSYAIDVVANNIGHGNRNIRTFLYAPLGLAVGQLRPASGGFDQGMMQNFRIGHMGNQDGIAILLASRLSRDQKKATLERWRQEAFGIDAETLDHVLEVGYCHHGMLTEYANIALHLAQVALAMPHPATEDPQMNLLGDTVTLQEVFGRIRKHPLFSTSVMM